MGPAADHGVRGRTVLVTGGAGFVGSHLAEALVADNEVRVLDDLSTGDRSYVPEGADLRVGDVTDEAALESAMDGVDLVFHEAAEVSVEASVGAPARTETVNVGGTLGVLEAARRTSARVVIASSAAIYGHPRYVPIDEDHPTQPTSPYGVSKLAADHYARLYADLYDLPTVVLRYFNVYGPRHGGGDYSGVIAAFVEQARAGGPLTVHGDGEQTRDFVHVRDVVAANLRAATTDHVGEAFNVGTGERVTIRGLAERVRSAVDPDAPIVHTDGRVGDVQDSLADVSSASERLGLEATVPLATGLGTLPGVASVEGRSPDPPGE